MSAEDVPTIPFRNSASVSQAQLEAILRRHLQKYGGEVEMGTRLVGIDQDGDKVTAKVTVAADGTESSIECDYLVAADGAKGTSRSLLGVPFLGQTNTADRLWTTNVEVPSFSREYWHRWGDFSKSATSLKPINPAPLFQMQTLGPSLPADIPTDLPGAQKLFNSIAGRDDLKFEKAEYITEWKANIRMTERFSVGRVYIAGDAAHCHSPAGGQGTNTAMQDALNLAWKLVLVINKKASPDLLKSYEAERMPVVAEMLNLSNALHAKAFGHIPREAFGDDPTGDGQTDPMQRTQNLLQLGVNYRWSDIVYDERQAKESAAEKNPYGALDLQIRAGDRAPYVGNLVMEDGNTADLFSLLREASSHIILFFTSTIGVEYPAPVKRLAGTGLIRVVPITRGVVQQIYCGDFERDVYVVVRPDGIIGGYVYGEEGLEEYFRRIVAA